MHVRYIHILQPHLDTCAQVYTMRSLAGSRCIITGASRGIGAAIARRFAEEGAKCTLIGRMPSTLETVQASLANSQEGGDSHRIIAGDVAQRSFWKDVAQQEKDVDVLVNAAGLTHYSLLVATKRELVDDIVQTNLMGTIWGCQVMVRRMMKRRQGCIINVSSLLGVKSGRGSTAYAASKAGIIGLTRSLAAEVGPLNIRVNAILPGYIDTQMTEGMTVEAKSEALSLVPLKRFGLVEEVADAAVFLAMNEYASNCVLNLDGGLSAT